MARTYAVWPRVRGYAAHRPDWGGPEPAGLLQAPVSMAALQDGRLLEVRGNPAPATIELDLLEDALPRTYVGHEEDRMLHLGLEPAVPQPPAPRPVTLRRVDLVFSDQQGRRLLATHFNQGPETGVCGDRGRPSVLAPWP